MTTRARARRWLPFVVSGALGFVLAFAGVALWLLPPDQAPQEVRVPSVVGLPWADAERRLASLGLQAQRGQARPSADVPRNAVVAQAPLAGATVNAGAEVVLDVSEGVERATVPATAGLARSDAERLLAEAGLLPGDVSEQPSDSARGLVLLSNPVAGVAVPRGTRVALVLSAGPGEVTLPDVVGRDAASARGLLEQIGLQLAPPEFDSLSTMPAGTVVAQTPAAGSAVANGSQITLRIAGRP